jgi:hypothetical protein
MKTKLCKACGWDNISAEVIKNPLTIRAIHKIVVQCFERGIIPDQWTKTVISPIFKTGNKDILDTNNYRGIALLCVPYKVYCDILTVRLSKWLEDNNLLAKEQNGF